jgi:hypothetical protein
MKSAAPSFYVDGRFDRFSMPSNGHECADTSREATEAGAAELCLLRLSRRTRLHFIDLASGQPMSRDR